MLRFLRAVISATLLLPHCPACCLIHRTLLLVMLFWANTGWAKKTGPFLRVNNFAKVSDRKACYTPKVCKFCLEDSVKVSCQCIKYSLLNLHRYSLSLKL